MFLVLCIVVISKFQFSLGLHPRSIPFIGFTELFRSWIIWKVHDLCFPKETFWKVFWNTRPKWVKLLDRSLNHMLESKGTILSSSSRFFKNSALKKIYCTKSFVLEFQRSLSSYISAISFLSYFRRYFRAFSVYC